MIHHGKQLGDWIIIIDRRQTPALRDVNVTTIHSMIAVHERIILWFMIFQKQKHNNDFSKNLTCVKDIQWYRWSLLKWLNLIKWRLSPSNHFHATGYLGVKRRYFIQWVTRWTQLIQMSLAMWSIPGMHFQSNCLYSKISRILIQICDVYSCGASFTQHIPNLKHDG